MITIGWPTGRAPNSSGEPLIPTLPSTFINLPYNIYALISAVEWSSRAISIIKNALSPLPFKFIPFSSPLSAYLLESRANE